MACKVRDALPGGEGAKWRDRLCNDAVLVRSIIDLGRNLGLQVTAEGFESENICRSLSKLGCDFAQGLGAVAYARRGATRCT